MTLTHHRFFFICALLLSLPGAALSRDAEIVVEVEANRFNPAATPDSTPLQDIPGLTLRQQGQGNPQSDLSIRGSSFSAAGVTVNGLSLRNAQTEHWHASVSMPLAWLDRSRVVTGMERFRLSTGHPAGSVALTLAPLLSDEHRLTAGAGNYGTVFGGAEMTSVEHFESGSAGVSAFVSGNHTDQSDAIAGNYLDRLAAGARISRVSARAQADLLTTLSFSEFGAQGFYGASPQYPAEERLTDSMVLGALNFMEDPEQPVSVSAAWRRTDDTYTLDRYNPSFYRNDHVTDFFTLHGAKRTLVTDFLAVDARADAEHETIESPSLGDHSRSRASLALIPDLTFGDITLSAGGSAEFFSSDSTRLLPAAGIEWAFSETRKLFASYTEALRQPSYTELNYESPDSLGNRGLERQHTRTAELGCRSDGETHQWQIALFYERAADTVDWVKTAPDARWTAVNLAEIESYGAEARGALALSADTDLSGHILVLTKDDSGSVYAGRYALDYPEFESAVSIRHRVSESVTLRLSPHLCKYADNPVRSGGDWLTDASAEMQWQPPAAERLALNAGIRNIFDDEFQFFPGQNSRGRSVYSSLTWKW
jgi:vitamin B12 transporter